MSPDMRPVHLRLCQACDLPVLHAVAEGMLATVDPVPLTPGLYALATAQGRPVFRLWTGASKAWLVLDSGIRLADGRHRHRLPALGAHPCRGPSRPLEAPGSASGSVCDLWTAQGWRRPATCPRRHSPDVTGCRTCEPPPFDHEE